VGPVCKCREGYSGAHCEVGDLSLSAECDLDPSLAGCEVCEGRCKVPDFTGDSFLLLPLEANTLWIQIFIIGVPHHLLNMKQHENALAAPYTYILKFS